MKNLVFDKMEKNDVIECLNCHYVDVAERWKEGGVCPECSSRAFKMHNDFVIPSMPEPVPMYTPNPYTPWYDGGGTDYRIVTSSASTCI